MPRHGNHDDAVVSEKLYGLMGLSGLVLLTLPFGGYELVGGFALWVVLAVAFSSVAGTVLMSRPSSAGFFRWLPPRILEKTQAAFDTKSKTSDRVTLAGFSLLGHLLTALVYVAGAFALGIDLGLSTLLVVSTAIIIATLLPISIGGMGVREGVAVALLGQVGVVPVDAVLVGLLGFLTGQLPALTGGLFLLLERQEPKPSHQSNIAPHQGTLQPSSAGGISAP